MHATLLTVLLVAGAPPRCVECQPQPTMVAQDCPCGNCDLSLCEMGCRGWGMVWGCLADCCGPMPQTCYAPRFGCYPGNNRHMHRYPAFHGYYYRQPYNYRHLFDYPWHATPHQPQGFLTCPAGRPPRQEEEIPTPYPEPETVPYEPLPLPPDAP